MLELYFEPLSRRNSEAYAEAYAAYFTDMAAAGELLLQEQEFAQSFPAQLCFEGSPFGLLGISPCR